MINSKKSCVVFKIKMLLDKFLFYVFGNECFILMQNQLGFFS
ncbi:hypothetical protein NU08_2670 [Flavobacterium anhuiense]|uniref:Uncharacterized protein n=1 Tax=Flavobacterium anhuiense TaxID=459526 RepID=A0A444VXM5_9FLAO|nr:hypothetical protein NU08_2670 [Flavobacterium anhuiense]